MEDAGAGYRTMTETDCQMQWWKEVAMIRELKCVPLRQ